MRLSWIIWVSLNIVTAIYIRYSYSGYFRYLYTLNIHWKDWYWSWSSSTLAIWCDELTHWKRPWFWERLKAGGEGDDRGWDGWMASPTQWTWVWTNSGRWWRTWKPVLQSVGWQRIGYNWATEQQHLYKRASQVVLVVRNSPANAGDMRDSGLIPGLGRSPGGGQGNPLQYSCLRNPMDWGAWRAIVHGVGKSRTRLKWLSMQASIQEKGR